MLGSRVGIFSCKSVVPATLPVTTNLQLWFDVTDSNTLFTDLAGTIPAVNQNDQVYLWKNKVTGGPNAISKATGTRPYLQTTDTTYMINGKNTLKFNFANASTLIANFTHTGTEVTAFIVMKRNSYVVNYGALSMWNTGDTNDYATNNALLIMQDYSPYELTCRNNQFFKQCPLVGNGLNFMYSVRLNLSTGLAEAYSNGVLGTGTAFSGTFSGNLNSDRISIGSRFNGLYTCNCNIGEVILYNRALNNTELGQIHSYLDTKWGISTPI